MDDPIDRESEVPRNRSESTNHHVVGIGASAGGLEALERFFDAVPEEPGVSIVVVQHLSPDYKSHMEELLARRTTLPIRIVQNGMSLEPNKVFLIPPGKTLIVSQNKFLLTDKDKSSVTYPIDTFFRSLASDAQNKAIGIVLSGTGTDGTMGIKEISEAGGLVIAQEEESAAFDGMPASAIETGVVKLILRPEEMPEAIIKYTSEKDRARLLDQPTPLTVEGDALELIFGELRAEFDIDFNLYKPNTIQRRLQRRIEANEDGDIVAYAKRVSTSKAEVHALYRDLLIDVTHFFRDEEGFKKLYEDVIRPLVKEESEQIRVWVAGCATGEEAYTISILLSEAFREIGMPPNFKVFGSDAHSDSVRKASEGIYSEFAVKNVEPELLERYFKEEDQLYTVCSSLRKNVVFTRHNLVKDVPFTKLHLITCRNLLIYLQPYAQKKVHSYFHFGLRSSGVLMLGPSESLGELADEFVPIDKHWKIFRKRRDVRLLGNPRVFGDDPMPYTAKFGNMPSGNSHGGGTARVSREELRMSKIYDSLLSDFMPPGVVVDEASNLLHTFPGGERFMSMRHGRSSQEIGNLVREEIRASVTTALQQAVREGSEVVYQGLTLNDQSGEITFDLMTRPIVSDARNLGAYLITFTPNKSLEDRRDSEMEERPDRVVKNLDDVRNLELQLRFAKENLQATIEELETGNEELQATNEELVASNEELQSSNEELHSVNEELDTVNSELQSKIVELSELNEDIDNMLASTEIGVLFIDGEMNVRKVTPVIAEVFGLGSTDIGRKLPNLSTELGRTDLREQLQRVRNGEELVESEFSTDAGVRYLLRITPYQSDTVESGLVVAIFDITSLREIESRATELSNIVMSSSDAIIGLSFGGTITSWNKGAEKLYGYSAEEAEGRNALNLIVPPEEAAEFMTELDMARQGETLEARTMNRRTKMGHQVVVTFRLSTAAASPDSETQISSIERDITDEMVVRHDRDRLAEVLENTMNFVGITDLEGKVLFINAAGREMVGLSQSDSLDDLTVDAFHTSEDFEMLKEQAIPEALEKGRWRGRNRLKHKDGHLIPVSQVILRQEGRDGQQGYLSTIISDLTSLEKAYDKLTILEAKSKKTAETLKAVIEDFPEMLVVTDADLAVQYASTKAQEFLGSGVDDEWPLGLHDLLAGAIKDNKNYLPEGAEGVVSQTGDSRSPKHYLPRISLLRSGQEVLGAVLTLQDVTEFKLLEDIKTDLIGAVGHELKNPVTGISLNLDLALEGAGGELSNELERLLKSSSEECARISGTIESLLNLTRFESSDRKLEKAVVPVGEIIQHSLTANQLVASIKGIELAGSIEDPELPVNCDQERILIVLNNLISNAVKYGPENSKIEVGTRNEEAQIRIYVSDSGGGIDEGEREKVFDKFYRIKSNGKPGSGLGLNIAKEFVEAHGGRIGVEESEYGGAKFFFTLPV